MTLVTDVQRAHKLMDARDWGPAEQCWRKLVVEARANRLLAIATLCEAHAELCAAYTAMKEAKRRVRELAKGGV